MSNLLNSIHECTKNDCCWICGEELKRKEKRIFMLSQLETAFVAAYGNLADPRRAAFTESITDASNLYEWWSAFISVDGETNRFIELISRSGTVSPGSQQPQCVDVFSTIVVACQRSSSSCSSLYTFITASKDTIQDLDPVRKKLLEDEASRMRTSHIYQPQFIGANSTHMPGRSSTGVRYRPCSLDHWSYVISSAKSMEGWMTKRSHEYFTFFRKWQQRYFVLDIEGKSLSYYRDSTKIHHRGTYRLTGAELRALTQADGRPLAQYPFQLEVRGTNHHGRVSTLYVYVDSLQCVDFWFACLRYTIRGEHYKIAEMKNWLYALNKLLGTCNDTFHLLNFDGTPPPSSISMSSTTTGLGTINMPASFQGSSSFMTDSLVASGSASPSSMSIREQLAAQRMKIENCRHLVETLEPVLLRVLGRICEEEPYSHVDCEFASAQKPVLQAALQFIVLLQNSCLSESASGLKHLFDEQWTRNLDLAYQVLTLTPQSLLHVHVRDMRVNTPGADREYDKFEIPYVYDLALHDIVIM